MVKAVIFDWGDTLMRDFPGMQGPMALWPAVEIVSGAAEALRALDHRSLVCCVASNAGDSDAELMGLALERAGIRSYFQHLFTSKELGSAKPDPRFFIELASRLGLAPGECVMVGNDYQKDILGARAAGMQTVWLRGDAVQETHADTLAISRMDELPGAISHLAHQP